MPLEHRPAYWTHDDEAAADVGHLYYFAPINCAPGPYHRQIEVRAIIDIADDGTLAGVELIDHMPPPPTSKEGGDQHTGHQLPDNATPAPDVTGERAPASTDNAPVNTVLEAILECALAWERDARLIGNVRAGDIVRACRAVLSPALPPVTWMETTAEERAALRDTTSLLETKDLWLSKFSRDFDRLLAALDEARDESQREDRRVEILAKELDHARAALQLREKDV